MPFSCQSIAFEETKQFSSVLIDYINQKPSLKDFYGSFPTLEAFEKQISLVEQQEYPRQKLVQVLENQYKNLEISKRTKQNIQALSDKKTFTITTGHQLSIFGGQMYFVYKIITTIRLAEELKKKYPQYHFVPVFWLASEDHDLTEIQSFQLFGKTYTWQTSQTGAVGRMRTENFEALFQEIPEKTPIFEKAYLHSKTIAEATMVFVNELFGKDGLVCLNPDDASLKIELKEVLKNEILEQNSYKLIQKTTQKLVEKGYSGQITPREINLFWLENNNRERVVQESEPQSEGYKVLNSSQKFTKTEILEAIEKTPENFSPNVALRPVYQQVILPNIAYIGGAAEIAYWFQLKDSFDYISKNVDKRAIFPILMPRNFAMVFNKATQKRFEKLELQLKDLFLDEFSLKKTWLERNTQNSLSLSDENKSLESIFKNIQEKANRIDKSLENTVLAELQKTLKGVENLEKRLQKSEERNQETQISQLIGLKQKLFPNNHLQEREENFLNFALNNPNFLDEVKSLFNPFDFSLQVLVEREA